MTLAGLPQRLGSRILRGLGLTRRQNALRLAEDVARLEAALAQARSEAATRTTEMRTALRELEFRTARWRELVALSDADPFPHHAGLAPLAFRPRLSVHDRPRHCKLYEDRPLRNGLTALQAFHLELMCLDRLQRTSRHGRQHFPALARFDESRPSLWMSHTGRSLDLIQGRARGRMAERLSRDFEDQLKRIVRRLERARIVHLDMHPTGRNITADRDGRLALIDFDLAAIDDTCFSAEIIRRHADWRANGRYDRTLRQLTTIVGNFIRSAR